LDLDSKAIGCALRRRKLLSLKCTMSEASPLEAARRYAWSEKSSCRK
jgi:hypothetical protein